MVLGCGTEGGDRDSAASEEALRPPGYWALDPAGRVEREEAARLESLPYAAAGARATGSNAGVVLRDPERATPGGSFYVSGHGPEAILIDPEGRPIHRWRFPFDRASKRPAVLPDSTFWRRAVLLPDGSVVALVQASGLLRVDRDSRLLWVSDSPAYNDLLVSEEGTVLTLAKELAADAEGPSRHLEDFLLELDLETGREIRRWSLFRALERSPWASYLPSPPYPDADVLHSNTVTAIPDPSPSHHPAFVAGRLIVSLRQIDTIVVFDPATGEIVWARRGPWVRQHDPALDGEGRLVVFDNQGGAEGRSRVLRWDLERESIAWQFPPEGDPPLDSFEAGAIQVLPEDHLLVTESVRGRAFEVTPNGEIVWEFVNPHRLGDHEEFIAYLWELARVPFAPETLGLEGESPR